MVLESLRAEFDRLEYRFNKLDRMIEACSAGDLDDLDAAEDLVAEVLKRAEELGAPTDSLLQVLG